MDTFTKQPGETLDYDIETDDWLTDTDSIQSAVTTVSPAGLMVSSTTIFNDGKNIKLWISGGTSGVKYKTTTTITTADGRIKEHEIQFKVKER